MSAVLPGPVPARGPLSALLDRAADAADPDRPALAAWLRSEAVHAADAEDVAARASDLALTGVAPSYALATRHAAAVAAEALPGLP